jgi:hypothetical protein
MAYCEVLALIQPMPYPFKRGRGKAVGGVLPGCFPANGATGYPPRAVTIADIFAGLETALFDSMAHVCPFLFAPLIPV